MDRVVNKSDGVIQHRRGRILPQRVTCDGYKTVRLSRDANRRQFYVHVLVALAFVDGYFPGAEVNHKDFDRSNNDFSNLEWVTHLENIEYSIRSGRHITQRRDMSGENNPNFGNRKLSERYSSDTVLAIAKQSRKGSQNGRAVPIQMILPDGSIYSFGYMIECAKQMIDMGLCKSVDPESVSAYVSKAARTGKKYCGCDFSYLK